MLDLESVHQFLKAMIEEWKITPVNFKLKPLNFANISLKRSIFLFYG